MTASCPPVLRGAYLHQVPTNKGHRGSESVHLSKRTPCWTDGVADRPHLLVAVKEANIRDPLRLDRRSSLLTGLR